MRSSRLAGSLSRSLLLVGLLTVCLASIAEMAAAHGGRVVKLELDGAVDPFTASYLEKGIEEANESGALAVLITIDTPGGLDSSMRTIVKAILASRIPVICYTGPAGARAASAGAFIMLACPVSAMAPGTSIGAAHPVGVSGAIEQQKVTNDAASYIRSLALRWGRNADWAEDAVRDSISTSAQEASRLGVIDLVAPSEDALLDLLSDRPLRRGGGAPVRLHLSDATVDPRGMGIAAGFLHALIDPNLAFLFFYLGLGLIVVEILNPGLSVPGVLGTLLLVSAVVSFGALPVRLGGIALLVASAVFFLLELKHPGVGLPTAGGVACLVLGGLLLFDPAVPDVRVSRWLLGGVAVAVALFFAFVVRGALRMRGRPVASGVEGIVGDTGVALEDLHPRGLVRVARETWSAETTGASIPRGAPVRVVRVAGVRLIVEPGGTAPIHPELAGRPSAGRKEK